MLKLLKLKSLVINLLFNKNLTLTMNISNAYLIIVCEILQFLIAEHLI